MKLVRSMDKYKVLDKIGEGTFAIVLQCQSLQDGQLYAMKHMKSRFASVEEVNSLREVQALRRLGSHANIVNMIDVIYNERNQTLDLVCELMDMNIYEKIRDRDTLLPEKVVKSYMYQLTKALDHMHRNLIFHRDVKPENILINDKTQTLKLADFGSCRGRQSKAPFTEYISTRWYRAPECLLTNGYYNEKMDLWSIGCVFFEILTLRPLFPGTDEIDQIAKIHEVLGTPPAGVLNKIRKNSMHMKFSFPITAGVGLESRLSADCRHDVQCLDLMRALLEYDPETRLTTRQALRHPYFAENRELEPKAAALQQEVLNEGDKIMAKSKPGKAKGLRQNPQRQNQLPQVQQLNPAQKPPQKQQKQQKQQAYKTGGVGSSGIGGVGGGYSKAPSSKAPSVFGKRTELKGPLRKPWKGVIPTQILPSILLKQLPLEQPWHKGTQPQKKSKKKSNGSGPGILPLIGGKKR